MVATLTISIWLSSNQAERLTFKQLATLLAKGRGWPTNDMKEKMRNGRENDPRCEVVHENNSPFAKHREREKWRWRKVTS